MYRHILTVMHLSFMKEGGSSILNELSSHTFENYMLFVYCNLIIYIPYFI